MNTQLCAAQTGLPLAGQSPRLVELSPADAAGVGGGMAYIGLSWFGVAFAAGYAVGTAIDRAFIAPLWR